jgi:DNA-binding MarR family transcriptional regulator
VKKRATRLQDEIRQTRPFASPAEEAHLALLRTADRLSRRITDLVEPLEITAQQYNVLRILRGSHPGRLPTLEIAERMIEQAPGITRLLDRLEAKGLVARERCDEDRRRVYCSITPAGIALLAALDRPVAGLARKNFETLSDNETRQLIRLLEKLRSGLGVDGQDNPGDAR